MTNAKTAILAVALKELLTGSFYVTDIEKMAEVAGVEIPADTLAQMRLLHCVNYRDMPEEVKTCPIVTGKHKNYP